MPFSFKMAMQSTPYLAPGDLPKILEESSPAAEVSTSNIEPSELEITKKHNNNITTQQRRPSMVGRRFSKVQDFMKTQTPEPRQETSKTPVNIPAQAADFSSAVKEIISTKPFPLTEAARVESLDS